MALIEGLVIRHPDGLEPLPGMAKSWDISADGKEYIFYFVNMHPATDNADLRFQANKVGGSGYNETMTTTNHQAYHEVSLRCQLY